MLIIIIKTYRSSKNSGDNTANYHTPATNIANYYCVSMILSYQNRSNNQSQPKLTETGWNY